MPSKNATGVYARIETHYRDILIPVEHLADFLKIAYLAKTDYSDGEDRLSELVQPGRCKFHYLDEIESVLMHQKLSGAE